MRYRTYPVIDGIDLEDRLNKGELVTIEHEQFPSGRRAVCEGTEVRSQYGGLDGGVQWYTYAIFSYLENGQIVTWQSKVASLSLHNKRFRLPSSPIDCECVVIDKNHPKYQKKRGRLVKAGL